jgi:uncharacterized membrane protein
VLRLLYLGQKSFWWDEIFTAKIARVPWPEFWQTLWRFEANMSLYYLLVRVWIQFGHSESWLRLLSAIFAIASIPLIYQLGVEVSGAKTGFVAALLLTINAAHVAYAQEARSYALLMLLCILSLLYFLRIEKSGWSNAAGYVLVSVLAVYAQFFAIFFLAAQWASLAWLPPGSRSKRFLLPVTCTIVLISPALYYMLFRRTHQLDWVTPTRLKDLERLAYFLAADSGKYHKALAALYLICAAAALICLFARRQAAAEAQRRWSVMVVACCAILPVVITFALSFWVTLFGPRYLLMCLPPVILLAAQGLLVIRPAWLRFAIGVLILAISPFTLRWYYAQPKIDFRGLTAYLLRQTEPRDVLVGFPKDMEWPVQYYASELSPAHPKMNYWGASAVQEHLRAGNTSAGPLDRVWVMTWATQAESAVVLADFGTQYERVEQREFAGPITLALYTRKTGAR